jgi:hypothetical protein
MSPLELVEAPEVERTADDADGRVETVPYSVRLAQRQIGWKPTMLKKSERRAHPRHSGEELNWVRVARLKRGDAVTLVDLSSGGALLETEVPLKPGTSLTLEIIGEKLETTVPFRVLRCFVANLRGETMVYRGACSFNRLFELPAPNGRSAPPETDFVGTEAALNYLLERYANDQASPAVTDIRITLEREQVLHVLDSLRARAATGGLDPEGHHAADLLNAVLPALHRGAPRQTVLAALEAEVQQLPDVWQSRLQSISHRLIALVDLCSAGEAVVGAAVVEQVSPPAADVAEDEESDSKTAFQRIVARYADGKTVKGYTQDFHPSRQRFSVWPSIKSPAAERVSVPIAKLKAVFFVRDFKGNAAHKERKSFSKAKSGRRIEVTFLDGEVILGTTLNYRPDAQGFFVVPGDPTANNTRVFVVSSAVKRVRFP